MVAKCSRCHKNPVTRPAYICRTCGSAPKKRRASRGATRAGHAAAVVQRSAATTFPVASAAWYAAQPEKES